MNPFLQQSVILSGIESNPFLSIHVNNSQKPFSTVPNISLSQESNVSNSTAPNISLSQESNVSHITIFTNNNPFLNIGTDTRVDTASTPKPVTQVPEPVTNTPSSSAPAPDNPFSTFYVHNPITITPPSLGTPSLLDLISITSDSTKTIAELSK